jgi:hypothetical protein
MLGSEGVARAPVVPVGPPVSVVPTGNAWQTFVRAVLQSLDASRGHPRQCVTHRHSVW